MDTPHVGIVHGNRPWDSPVDAKNVLVDDRHQGHPIKDLVAGLPDSIANVSTKTVEAFLALPDEGALAVVLLPPIDIPSLVVSSQQKYLVWILQLHRQEIRNDFQTVHAPIHVVAQKQKVPGGETHAEPPDIVGKEMEIFQVPVNVPEYVTGTLQVNDAGFPFQDLPNLLAQLEQVRGKELVSQVLDVLVRTLEHFHDAHDDGMASVPIALRRWKRGHHPPGVKASVPAHAVPPCPNDAAPRFAAIDVLDVDGVGRHFVRSFVGVGVGFVVAVAVILLWRSPQLPLLLHRRLELIGKSFYMILQANNLLVPHRDLSLVL
mmetsp:Transcript_23109/g.64075  ORF Transcript_23109/g.64075 Transcript_23109/m.64075 type:complete len:319 (+) Transcript_23109:1541-2497(+)